MSSQEMSKPGLALFTFSHYPFSLISHARLISPRSRYVVQYGPGL
jgi:hypothetical protein